MTLIQFFGSFLGMLLLGALFWVGVEYYVWARNNGDTFDKFKVIAMIVISVNILGNLHFRLPIENKFDTIGNGIPIKQNLEGMKFTPQAFVVTAKHVLIYNSDGKIYSLDGVKFADSLSPEKLPVGSNVVYTVYSKAEQLYFDKL